MSTLEFAFHDTWWTVANTQKIIRKQQAVGSNLSAGSHSNPHNSLICASPSMRRLLPETLPYPGAVRNALHRSYMTFHHTIVDSWLPRCQQTLHRAITVF